MDANISKKTVVILAVIAILVSFIGTFIVLKYVDNMQSGEDSSKVDLGSSASGSITVRVLGGEEEPPVAAGSVGMNILPNS